MSALRAFVFVLVAFGMVPVRARAADPVPAPTQIVSRDRIAAAVGVRDVTAQDGTVSGVLVNRTSHRLQDVRLCISHLWLWNDERHPGEDRWSRFDFYTVPGDVPPGGTMSFTYRGAPLEGGPGGRFTTMVEPMGFVELVEPPRTSGGGLPQ